MRIVRIPKGRGKYRTIYVPSCRQRKRLRRLVPLVAQRAAELDVYGVQHGFVAGRSPVTNAFQHVGWQFTVNFDLVDFFDHVTDLGFAALVPEEARPHVFVDGAARQGLPTSPAVANIAGSIFDGPLYRMIEGRGVYTRYADDLTFSTASVEMVEYLLQEVPKVVRAAGFRVNPEKTHRQAAVAGRRVITGIAVDDVGMYPTREFRRRLRAAAFKERLHPDRSRNHIRGLREWGALKLPEQRGTHDS